MGKWRRILLASLVVIIFGGLFFAVMRPRETEPVYQGKPLSAWLAFYSIFNTNRSNSQLEETQTAIRQMGTNAIPTLLRMLRTSDSPLKRMLMPLIRKQHVINIKYDSVLDGYIKAEAGFLVLGHRAESAVPELIKIYDLNVSQNSQMVISTVLGLMGPAAKPAVPSLLRASVTSNVYTGPQALWAVKQIDPEAAAKAGVK